MDEVGCKFGEVIMFISFEVKGNYCIMIMGMEFVDNDFMLVVLYLNGEVFDIEYGYFVCMIVFVCLGVL